MTQEPFVLENATFFVIGAGHRDSAGPFICRLERALEGNSSDIRRKAQQHNLRDDWTRQLIRERWERVHGRPWPAKN